MDHRTSFTVRAVCPLCGVEVVERGRTKAVAEAAFRVADSLHAAGHAAPTVVCVSTRPSVGAA